MPGCFGGCTKVNPHTNSSVEGGPRIQIDSKIIKLNKKYKLIPMTIKVDEVNDYNIEKSNDKELKAIYLRAKEEFNPYDNDSYWGCDFTDPNNAFDILCRASEEYKTKKEQYIMLSVALDQIRKYYKKNHTDKLEQATRTVETVFALKDIKIEQYSLQ